MTDNKKSILVTDDELDIVELFDFHFKQHGFNVLTASNGQEALACLSQNHIDLIISDIRMPMMDGIEFLEKVVLAYGDKRPYHIIVSGHSDITEEEAIEKGALAYFSKPVSLRDLTDLVHSKLD